MRKRINKADLQYKESLVDKYLTNELSVSEKKDFRKYINSDLGFRARIQEELELSNALVKNIYEGSRSVYKNLMYFLLLGILFIISIVGVIRYCSLPNSTPENGSSFPIDKPTFDKGEIDTYEPQEIVFALGQKDSSRMETDNLYFDEGASVAETIQLESTSTGMPLTAVFRDESYDSNSQDVITPTSDNLSSLVGKESNVRYGNEDNFDVKNEKIVEFSTDQYYDEDEGPITLQLARLLAHKREEIRDLESFIELSKASEDAEEILLKRLELDLLQLLKEEIRIRDTILKVEEQELESPAVQEKGIPTETYAYKLPLESRRTKQDVLVPVEDFRNIEVRVTQKDWRQIIEFSGIDASDAEKRIDRCNRTVENYLRKLSTSRNLLRSFSNSSSGPKKSPFEKYDYILEVYVIAQYLKTDPEYGDAYEMRLKELASLFLDSPSSAKKLEAVLDRLPVADGHTAAKANIEYLKARLHLESARLSDTPSLRWKIQDPESLVFNRRYELLTRLER